MKQSEFIVSGLIGFALYLIATGISFAGFSYAGKGIVLPGGFNAPTPTPAGPQSHFRIDPSIPKTEECPINGKMYTQTERDTWEKRRPIAVMIENHADSRPQSGLSRADIVYEAVAEGGITRFMGIFYCDIAYTGTKLAPVRSARTYFLPWVLEYDALYNHVGGAGRCNDDTVDDRAKALCQIDTYKIKDMDQFGLPFKYKDATGAKIPVCGRNYDRLDHPVATEHTMVCESDGLYAFSSLENGWTNVDAKGVSWDKNFSAWKWKDDDEQAERGASFSAQFTAWQGYENDYGVKWVYDKATNTYKRYNGGVAHIDLETGEQLTAKTVIIQYAKETGPVDDHMHLLYQNIGAGSGMIFSDGKTQNITWKKPDRNARTVFYDSKGKEILLNRGTVWIELLPIGTDIQY